MGQTFYPSKSWVFKSHFPFKVRQHCQRQLYLQYKVCWILYRMVSAPSFSQPSNNSLCIQCACNHSCSLYQKYFSLFQLMFTSLFHPSFFTNSSLQSTQTLPSSNFPPPYFSIQPSQQSTPKMLSYANHLANSGYTREPRSSGDLWGMTLL